uniref:MAP7 domain containing 3 n=1 Tax=Nannospalax galili TaxID=1026970 RepID=A0A8C6RPM7_NANGA
LYTFSLFFFVLVAVAQEIAEERRHKCGVNSLTTPNKRSSFINGSVLKNDVKQQLAKERREERKRQQEANKEKQLLEKERKAKLQYERQSEEKQRKLKEQKEKDERRRISAEEKRKQKLAEDKEKFKAVISRTMERCNRVDQPQKRLSWEGSGMNTEHKSGKTETKRSSSLNRRESKLHSSVNPEHMDNTGDGLKKYVKGLERWLSMNKYVFRYVTVPMFNSDELKASAMFCKSTVKMPIPVKLQLTTPEKVETPLKEDVKEPVEVNMQVPVKLNMEIPSKANEDVLSKANVNVPLKMNTEDTAEVNVDVSPKVNIGVPIEATIEGHPKSNVEELPMVSMDASPSVGSYPIVIMESSPIESVGSSSLVNVEISPVVSIDASPEASIDTSPELCMDSASLEMPSEANIETPLKASGKLQLEASVEAHPEANVEASAKNPEMDKQTLKLTTKKQLSSNIPCYKWPSSPTLGWHLPSPMKAMQMKKNRPPSPLPVSRKVSTQTPMSYKITPVQSILYVPNSLGVNKMSETVCQKYITNPELSNRSMPHSDAALKIPAEIHQPAYEQNNQMEKDRCTKEKEQSVTEQVDAMADKTGEVPAEELSPYKDELQEKDLTKKRCRLPSPMKKGDATSKCQGNAEMRKKEHERIMLRNLQERLERRKNATSEEDEADDEEETESDEGSVDELFPSGIRNSSTKIRKFHKNAKKRPQKLVFLQAETGEVDTEKIVYFNGNVKAARPKDPKDSSTQVKGSKIPTRKSSTRITRMRKTKEANATILRSSLSEETNQQWVSDRTADISHHTEHTESPVTKTIPDSDKHNLKESVTSQQGPQVPLNHKKRSKPVSSPLGNALSHHFTQKATDLKPFPVSSYFRAPFGEDDDSGEYVGMILEQFSIKLDFRVGDLIVISMPCIVCQIEKYKFKTLVSFGLLILWLFNRYSCRAKG